ncbi:MAG: AMIN domain-containing protein [Gemmatimonadota bacterium]
MKCLNLMVLLLAALAASPPIALAQEVSVTGIEVMPSAVGPELTIELNGPARFTDFTLENPARIVVDVQGAQEALPRSLYAVERGGIAAVRSSQFAPGIVRIVVDLARPATYSATEVPEGILLSVATGEIVFEPWSTGPSAPLAGQAGPQPGQPVPVADRQPAPGADPLLEQEQPRITVTFQEAEIHDVLASFAEFTGRSIVPGSDVAGLVTATIRNQPWDVALQTILRAYGLAAQEMPSGIIQVDAIGNLQERQTLEPLVTQTFRINYVPVNELASSLESLSSERGRISSNPSTNTLIVTDVESVLDNMGTILTQLDVRTPQVSIQAKIIFVNRTDVEELGVTYDLKDSQGSSLNELVSVPDPLNPGEFTSTDIVRLGGNSIAALGNANVRVQQPQLETVLSLVLGRHTLIAFIDALQSQELSDVQAAPLITTLDNQLAEIWVGERTPIRVVDIGTAGGAAAGGATAPRATAELVETGIRLRVTPHITADRRILMQLHAERSSAQLAATDIGVVFQQQQGTTRLMVEDGETAVIGGLTVTEVVSTRAGIPFLMDLPVIGALFRTTRDREQKRDLLIMVTPRIVEDRA